MVRRRPIWYRRFADVPGVGYQGDDQRRSRLPERDLVPEVHEFDFDGTHSVSLSWTTRRGSSSASPVHELAFGDFAKESSAQVRERVLSALELPGEPMDYHFAMQGAAELFYGRRRTDPSFLPFVEWLAWFDARLVETHEPLFRVNEESSEYISVFALGFLVDFHEREGYLHEALQLAERFARFTPRVDISELRARVALLRSEHA